MMRHDFEADHPDQLNAASHVMRMILRLDFHVNHAPTVDAYYVVMIVIMIDDEDVDLDEIDGVEDHPHSV